MNNIKSIAYVLKRACLKNNSQTSYILKRITVQDVCDVSQKRWFEYNIKNGNIWSNKKKYKIGYFNEKILFLMTFFLIPGI